MISFAFTPTRAFGGFADARESCHVDTFALGLVVAYTRLMQAS